MARGKNQIRGGLRKKAIPPGRAEKSLGEGLYGGTRDERKRRWLKGD